MVWSPTGGLDVHAGYARYFVPAQLIETGAAALAAEPQEHEGYGNASHANAARAKISMAQARAIALCVHAGRITDAELENEGGGSGLRYSFDIVSGGETSGVGVDAVTGGLLENKAEGPHPD